MADGAAKNHVEPYSRLFAEHMHSGMAVLGLSLRTVARIGVMGRFSVARVVSGS